MFKSKYLGLFIVLLMISACTAAPQSDQSVSFSMLYNNNEDTPFQEDWLILQEYLNRKNVVFDIRLGNDAEYNNTLNQTLKSGNIPDIVLKVYPNTIDNYAASGLLLPFSDYEKQMPYFKAFIDEHNLQNELDKLRLDNGKYYILPGFQRKIQVQQWIYRQDLFEQHNLPIPTTYDELFEFIGNFEKAVPSFHTYHCLLGRRTFICHDGRRLRDPCRMGRHQLL